MPLIRLLEHQFELPLPLEGAWQLSTNVDDWPRWATHIAWVELQPPGPINPETKGSIQLRNGFRSTFRVREFEPNRNWMWTGGFLWLTIHHNHIFESLGPMRTRLTFTIDGEGVGAAVVGRLFASMYGRSLDHSIHRLVAVLGSQRPD